jgi:hypothetical protein
MVWIRFSVSFRVSANIWARLRVILGLEEWLILGLELVCW